MRKALFSAIGFVLLPGAPAAQATVQVSIDLSHQRMHVDSHAGVYDWPISSARSGFSTPGGSYAPTHLEAMHYSRKYHMSPMPHAIFFRGGYAIHGTYATGSLGRPASHGCVRLAPGNAAALYAMVQREGARISISGSPPVSRAFYAGYGRRDRYRDIDAEASFRPNYARQRPIRRVYPAYAYGAMPGYGSYQPYGYAYAPDYRPVRQVYGLAPRRQGPLFPVFGE